MVIPFNLIGYVKDTFVIIHLYLIAYVSDVCAIIPFYLVICQRLCEYQFLPDGLCNGCFSGYPFLPDIIIIIIMTIC